MQSVPIGTMNMSPGRAAGLHTISATELFSARSERIKMPFIHGSIKLSSS